MSKNAEPWRELPREVADVLHPELDAIAREILSAIGQEVPEYARPLEGGFGQAVRTGVEQALQRFVRLISEPDSPNDRDREVYVALGRGELRAGRTLDALQAAYRVGARVAWRGFARASHAAELDQHVVTQLAEAVFAYIDELSAESVEGYAEAHSELAGERQHRRVELVAALVGGVDTAHAPALAALAGWNLPRTAATLACPGPRLSGLARRLGGAALAAPFDGMGCAIVPDADGPGQRERIKVAAAGRAVALGPDLPLSSLELSWRLAKTALELSDGDELIVADEHLGELLVRQALPVVERIGELRLAALEGLSRGSRARMTETALAYVQHRGNAAAMARALDLHPQTARYRLARLRELLGPQMDDPDARFELEAALRLTRIVRDGQPRPELPPGRRITSDPFKDT